jgi:hypothetical protein
LSLFSLSNGSLEILPSNQWPPHRSWTNENWWWFYSPMEFRMRISHAQWNTMWAISTQPCAVVSVFKSYIRIIWVGWGYYGFLATS